MRDLLKRWLVEWRRQRGPLTAAQERDLVVRLQSLVGALNYTIDEAEHAGFGMRITTTDIASGHVIIAVCRIIK